MDTPDTMAAALLKAATEVAVETVAVVRKGAQNIKTDAKRNVRQSAPLRHAHAAETIGYDVTVRKRRATEAVIGYDKDKDRGAGKKTGPGGIGNLLEFGGGGDHSPPHRDLGRALDAEEPDFLAAMSEVGIKGLTGRMWS